MRRGQPPKAQPSAQICLEQDIIPICLPDHMTRDGANGADSRGVDTGATEASNPKDKKTGQICGSKVVRASMPSLWVAKNSGDAKCIELAFTMKEREAVKRKLPIMGQFEDRLICKSNRTSRGSSVRDLQG